MQGMEERTEDVTLEGGEAFQGKFLCWKKEKIENEIKDGCYLPVGN